MTFEVIRFPIDHDVIDMAFGVFHRQKGYVVIVAQVVFLIRLLINHISFKGARSFGDILFDVLLMSVLLGVFPSFIELITKIPTLSESISGGAGSINVEAMDLKDMGLLHSLFWGVTLVKTITLISYWLSYFVYQSLLFILIAAAAWAIFAGTIVNLRLILPAFFACLIITSAWPVCWYGINVVLIYIAKNIGVFGAQVVSVGGDLAKLAVPIYLLKKSWHTQAAYQVRGAIHGLRETGRVTTKGAKTVARGSAKAAEAIGFDSEVQWMRNQHAGIINRVSQHKQNLASTAKKFGPAVKGAAKTAALATPVGRAVAASRILRNNKQSEVKAAAASQTASDHQGNHQSQVVKSTHASQVTERTLKSSSHKGSGSPSFARAGPQAGGARANYGHGQSNKSSQLPSANTKPGNTGTKSLTAQAQVPRLQRGYSSPARSHATPAPIRKVDSSHRHVSQSGEKRNIREPSRQAKSEV